MSNSQTVRLMAVGTGLMLLLVMIAAMLKSKFVSLTDPSNYTQIGDAKTLGKVLFGEYLMPFELTSILFLSAMVGVMIFNKREAKEQ
jgi:NADH-quinone oxidoreductase subunit J